MPKRKRRRRPLKRALTPEQTRAQLVRYDRLLDRALDRQQALLTRQIMKNQNRITKYRSKLRYYRERVQELTEVQTGRPARAIRLEQP